MADSRRLLRALLGCALGATLLIAGGVSAALAGDDDEDDTIDTKIMKDILHGLGLKSPGDAPDIDYHERSPLVVPPTRDLPPPEAQGREAVAKDPAWPKDPDVARRAANKKAKAKRPAVVNLDDDMRQLRPDELSTGSTKPPSSPLPRQETEPRKQVSPSALGFTGFDIGSVFFGKEETVPFTGEPPRASLTEPPPGLRTPSPNQPYGTKGGLEPTKSGGDDRHELGPNR